MKTKIFFFFLLITPLLSAQDYYPLAVGNLWKYKCSGKSCTQNVFVKNYDKYTELYNVVTYEKYGDATTITEEIIDKRISSITVVSVRGGLSGLIGNDEWSDVNSRILQLPLKIGKKWENTKRKITYEVIRKVDVKINSNTFKNVFVIKKTDGKFIDFQYYAPNTGLIKITMASREGIETTDEQDIALELISAEIK